MPSASNTTEPTSSNDEIYDELTKLAGEVYRKIIQNSNCSSASMWVEHKEIRTLLGQITDIQSGLSDTDKQLEDKRGADCIESLVDFCVKRGAVIDGVKVADSGDIGYQLVATRALEPGQMVITVPRSAVLCLDVIKRSSMMKRFFTREKILSTMDNVALALGVCAHQLKEGSPWKPYLNVFPSSFDCPLYYSLEQLESMRASSAFEDALNFYRSVARQFCYFLSLIDHNRQYDRLKKEEKKNREPPALYEAPFTLRNFTFSLYRWAVCSVSTRINNIPSQYERHGETPRVIPGLIPLIDFANHEFHPQWDHPPSYSETEEQSGLPVNKRLEEGEPLTIQYGLRSNAEFLLHNAFVPEPNPFNRVKLRIALPRDDAHVEEKMNLLQRMGFSKNSRVYVFELFMPEDEGAKPFDETLIRFVRILVSNPPTEEKVQSDEALKSGVKYLNERFGLLLRCINASKEMNASSCVGRLLRAETIILNEASEYCSAWAAKLKI